MTMAQTGTLVFKNEAGDYFLLPQETLEQGRVPEEHKAEVEQAIAAAEGGAGGDDVQGHLHWFWKLFVFIPDLPPEEGPYPPEHEQTKRGSSVREGVLASGTIGG